MYSRFRSLSLVALLAALWIVVGLGQAPPAVTNVHVNAGQTTTCSGSNPCVTGISGTLTHGSTGVVLTGQNFGSKTTAAPLGYEQFEQVGYKPGMWTDSLKRLGADGNEIGTTNQRHQFSTKNAFFNFRGVDVGDTGTWTTNFSTGNIWFTAYYFFLASDWNWGTNFQEVGSCPGASGCNLANIKVWRMGDPAQNGDHDPVLSTVKNDTVHWFNYNQAATDADALQAAFTLNTWHLFEQQFDAGSLNTANGSLKVYLDGTLYINVSGVQFRGSGYNNGRPYGMSFWNSWNDNSTDNNTYYDDDKYVDNNWARVYACPGSTFAARGKCEFQIPTAWAAGGTSITITAQQGALSSLHGAYIYVVNSSGNVNANGFLIP